MKEIAVYNNIIIIDVVIVIITSKLVSELVVKIKVLRCCSIFHTADLLFCKRGVRYYSYYTGCD